MPQILIVAPGHLFQIQERTGDRSYLRETLNRGERVLDYFFFPNRGYTVMIGYFIIYVCLSRAAVQGWSGFRQ